MNYLCGKLSEVHRYFIRLSFNGKNYHGWQMQKNAVTVQQVVTEAVSLVLRHPVEITGCGRTDTGVHAEEYFAHFDSEKEITDSGCGRLAQKLNSFLPGDIAIQSVFKVPADAHARFSATRRTYQYHISRSKDPFSREFSLYYAGPLDVLKMNRGAKTLKEFTDFSCFSRSHTQTKTNDCKIFDARWKEANDMLVFTITADRFLRNMVRAIVGTLLEMGRGKITEKGLREIILSKNRSRAGKSVAAQGLFLTRVKYPKYIF